MLSHHWANERRAGRHNECEDQSIHPFALSIYLCSYLRRKRHGPVRQLLHCLVQRVKVGRDVQQIFTGRSLGADVL